LELRDVDVVNLIRKLAEKVETHEVYYNLRLMRLKYIHPSTVEYVKLCIAMESMGLTITVSLMTALTGKNSRTILQILHRLGDNNILLLRKFKRSHTLVYTLNPAFKMHLENRGILPRLQEHLKELTGEAEVKPSVAA
jgi:hypothetical protein